MYHYRQLVGKIQVSIPYMKPKKKLGPNLAKLTLGGISVGGSPSTPEQPAPKILLYCCFMGGWLYFPTGEDNIDLFVTWLPSTTSRLLNYLYWLAQQDPSRLFINFIHPPDLITSYKLSSDIRGSNNAPSKSNPPFQSRSTNPIAHRWVSISNG